MSIRWMVLASLLTATHAAWAQDACKNVDMRSALGAYVSAHPEQYPSTAEYPEPATSVDQFMEELAQKRDHLVELQWHDSHTRWIGWKGPNGSFLMAVDCAGKLLDWVDLGEVETITDGPDAVDFGHTVFVTAMDGTGSDFVHKSVSLVAVKDGKIVKLWTETAYSSDRLFGSHDDAIISSYKETVNQAHDGFERTGETKYFASTKDYDWEKTPHKVSRVDIFYCWNAENAKFVRCDDVKH